MAVVTKIRKQGGAAVITIPPALLKLMKIEIGSELSLDVAEGGLVARPVSPVKRRYSLAELLVGADELRQLSQSLSETMDGDPIGREM